jgi:hypothetical protein
LWDGLDEGGDVLIVSIHAMLALVEAVLVFSDQRREAAVFGDELAQPVEDAHDGDVDFDSAVAVEDRG